MDKRHPFQRDVNKAIGLRARRHFQTIAIIGALDRAEQQATVEQFASAARIAARILSSARNGFR